MYRTSTNFTHGRSWEGGWFKTDFFIVLFVYTKKLKQRTLIHRRLSAISVLAVRSSFQTGAGWARRTGWRWWCSSRPTLSTSPVTGPSPWSIAAKDIRACLSALFTGKGADLVAAEAAFDELNNPAASTTQDMDMDEGCEGAAVLVAAAL